MKKGELGTNENYIETHIGSSGVFPTSNVIMTDKTPKNVGFSHEVVETKDVDFSKEVVEKPRNHTPEQSDSEGTSLRNVRKRGKKTQKSTNKS